MIPEEVFQIEWGGVVLMRANNLISNLLVAGCCVWMAWRLTQEIPQKSRARAAWVQFFVWTGYAALAGGFAHAFNYGFPEVRHTLWHKIAWIGGGLSMFFLAWTSAETGLSGNWRRLVQGLAIVQMGAFAGAIVHSMISKEGYNAFNLPRIHVGVSLMAWVIPVHLYSAWRKGPSGWPWLFAALAVIALTVPFYNTGFTPANWFDYNDISHLIEIGSIYCFFRAGKQTLEG